MDENERNAFEQRCPLHDFAWETVRGRRCPVAALRRRSGGSCDAMVRCLFVQHGKSSEFGSENRPNDLGTETYRMMGSGTYRTI